MTSFFSFPIKLFQRRAEERKERRCHTSVFKNTAFKSASFLLISRAEMIKDAAPHQRELGRRHRRLGWRLCDGTVTLCSNNSKAIKSTSLQAVMLASCLARGPPRVRTQIEPWQLSRIYPTTARWLTKQNKSTHNKISTRSLSRGCNEHTGEASELG